MFTHVMVGSDDIEKSCTFYDATFGALGIGGMQMEGRAFYGDPASGAFMVGPPADGQSATHANGGTIGLRAEKPEQVDAWHAAGLSNGGSSEGEPGPREYGPDPMYGAYLRDPFGNKLCAYVMGEAARQK